MIVSHNTNAQTKKMTDGHFLELTVRYGKFDCTIKKNVRTNFAIQYVSSVKKVRKCLVGQGVHF